MTSTVTVRTRWALLALTLMIGLMSASVSAQNDPLILPDTPQAADVIQPTPGTLPEDAQWRGFSDPSADSLGLPTDQTGETRAWGGSRAPSAPDPEPSNAPRDPAGNDGSEAFDFVGAYPWHQAGYLGGGTPPINIALIDFGFGGSSNIPANRKPDLTCLSSYPTVDMANGFGAPLSGDTGRGLDMAEVICDIAPDSKITLYKVKTSAKLFDAIAAADNTHQVIVIGTDFGASFGPGDGTFGRSDPKNVYTALADAKNAGAVVIVAAGNAHASYKSFTYTSGTSALSITAKPGDTVDISWSDWDTVQAGGGAREDISASLTGAGFSALPKAARSSGTPAFQWTIPACATDGNGNCSGLTLTLTGLTGNVSSVIVQVSVSGIGRAVGDPTGGGVLPFSGTISRPADSPHVITVGAVCADRSNNFPSVGYSARGPIFAVGGLAPGFPAGPYITANMVKPDISGPSQISINNSGVSDLVACNQGFSGTQAAAAHVGAMVALLRHNPVNSAFRGTQPQDNILSYLRTHAIDLPMENADGYDYDFGAGLSVLGSPNYDNDAQFSAIPLFGGSDKLPVGACTGADVSIDAGDILYVGGYNVGAAGMNGTIGAPLTSLAQAARLQAQDVSSNKCVIVLPGESVSPFLFRHISGVKIFGYNSITTGNYGPSQIFVNNVAQGRTDVLFRIRRAALVVEDMPGWSMSGFTFHGADSYNTSIQFRPQVLALDNADNATFSNNTVTDFPLLQSITLVDVFNGSSPVLIDGNSFLDLNGSNFPGVIGVEDSGTAANRVLISNNLFDGIDNASGSWSFTKNPASPDGSVFVFFTPVLHTLDSYTTIQSNVFRNNTSETLIQFMTRAKVAPYETAIIGNVILNNIIQTFDPLDNAGPLINGFHAQRIYIVNNTIVNNLLFTAGEYFLLIGRGDADPEDTVNGGFDWNGSLASDARWEIHNNFIYRNSSAPMVGDTDTDFNVAGCTNLAGTPDSGATHNWLYNLGAGQCSGSIANANITNDPYPVDGNGVPVAGGTYIFGGSDPTDPLYYRLTGNALAPWVDGIDEGDDALVTGTFPAFASGRDARNSPRRTDGDGDTGVTVDIGAFELAGPGVTFSQTTPVNNAVLTNVDAGFTWTPAPDAITYRFDLQRIENGSPINLMTLAGLTPAADADGLSCSVGCLFNLTAGQKDLLSDGGLFRWSVTVNNGLFDVLAFNAPFKFSLPTGTVLPLLNAGFETPGAKPKVAVSWKTNNKQGDDKRICGVGFGANGSSCSFQLKAKLGAKANAIKQKLIGPGIGEGGDRLTISGYVRRKNLAPNVATLRVRITYAPKNTALLKIVLPAGGTNTWEAAPYSNSIILTGTPTSMLISATIKGKKGMYWVDDLQLALD